MKRRILALVAATLIVAALKRRDPAGRREQAMREHPAARHHE